MGEGEERQPAPSESLPPRGVSTAERLREDLELHREELAAQNEELRRTNTELVQSRERHQELYDHAPIGYVTLDARGVTVEANLTAGRMLAVPRGQLLGRPFEHCIATSERGAFRSFVADLLGDGARSSLETMLIAATGPFRAQLHGARLDLRPAERHCVLALTDDTARHEAERLRQEREASVAEANRLESLQLLAGGVAHDFNNLLAVIVGMTTVTLRSLPSGSPLLEPLETAAQAGRRATALSRQLLAYTGRMSLTPSPIDLARTLGDMEPVLRALVPPSTDLAFDVDQRSSVVMGDASQIDQVVLNLVLNASQSIGERPGRVVVRLRQTASEVELSVSDDGPGMPEDVRKRAFDPFYTTKEPGRGLGLAVVLGNVRAHRASIECESRPGGGTVFRVTFPASARLPAAGSDGSPVAMDTAHLLVVDDQPPMLSTTARLLTLLGHTADTAGSCDEAVALFRQKPHAYDLALVDRTMPGADGKETVRQLRLLRPDLRVIFMSGYSPDDEGCAQLTPWALTKPFTLDEFQELLAKALAV